MCITNFVRRPRPVAVGNESNNKSAAASAATISSRPSLITQRLYSSSSSSTVSGGNIRDANSSNCNGSSNACGGVTIQAVSLDTLASLPQLLKTNHHQQFQQHQQLLHNPNVVRSSAFGSGHGAATGTDTAKKSRRKRKPQKPGLTAKNNERHFVQHHYHDHAMMDDDDVIIDDSHLEDEDQHNDGAFAGETSESADATDDPQQKKKRRGGVSISFPMKLHAVLEQMEIDGYSSILSWQPHGRAFKIHKPKEFTEYVMPHYFRQSKLTSFQRQLNLYGFSRLTKGPDAGSYYHELFLRGRAGLAKRMKRTKVKGTKYKAASNPDAEPDFYKMPPVLTSAGTTSHARSPQQAPLHVSDDSSSEGNVSSSFNGATDHYFDSPSSARDVMPYQHVTPQAHTHGTVTTMPPAAPLMTVNFNSTVADMKVMANTAKEEMEPIDFRSLNSSQFDPLPLQQSSNQHQMSMGDQSSTMFNPPGFSSTPSDSGMFSNFQAQSQRNFHVHPAKVVSTPVPACSTADKVLDAAIDEIFSPENGTSMDDVLELDSLFNATTEVVQGDEQLGLLLDRFLQEGM